MITLDQLLSEQTFESFVIDYNRQVDEFKAPAVSDLPAREDSDHAMVLDEFLGQYRSMFNDMNQLMIPLLKEVAKRYSNYFSEKFNISEKDFLLNLTKVPGTSHLVFQLLLNEEAVSATTEMEEDINQVNKAMGELHSRFKDALDKPLRDKVEGMVASYNEFILKGYDLTEISYPQPGQRWDSAVLCMHAGSNIYLMRLNLADARYSGFAEYKIMAGNIKADKSFAEIMAGDRSGPVIIARNPMKNLDVSMAINNTLGQIQKQYDVINPDIAERRRMKETRHVKAPDGTSYQ